MPRVKGLVIANKEVYQELDLEELTGLDFSGREPLVLAIAQNTIDYMRDRTSKSKDIYGNNFDGYSTPYKNSEEFEAYNKTNKVNMRLTGDMLLSMGFNVSGNTIRFEFDDQDEEVKAFGHMSGMEGHKFLQGKTPKRLFFGITKEDFENKILPNFQDDLDELKRLQNQDQEDETEISLTRLFENEAQLNNSLDDFLKGLFDDEEF